MTGRSEWQPLTQQLTLLRINRRRTDSRSEQIKQQLDCDVKAWSGCSQRNARRFGVPDSQPLKIWDGEAPLTTDPTIPTRMCGELCQAFLIKWIIHVRITAPITATMMV
jgi:hypothetical protein